MLGLRADIRMKRVAEALHPRDTEIRRDFAEKTRSFKEVPALQGIRLRKMGWKSAISAGALWS